MGWTSHNRSKFTPTIEYWQSNFGPDYQVLDVAQVEFNEVYAAVRHPKGYVFAFVAMQRWTRDSYYNFSYKDMDESVGPNIARCPERILDLLDPVEVGNGPIKPPADLNSSDWRDHYGNGAWNAQNWRDRCRAYHAKRKEATDIKPGTAIMFANHLSFTGGIGSASIFRFERGSTFTTLNGYRVRIRNWRSKEFTRLSEDDPRLNPQLARLLA